MDILGKGFGYKQYPILGYPSEHNWIKNQEVGTASHLPGTVTKRLSLKTQTRRLVCEPTESYRVQRLGVA